MPNLLLISLLDDALARGLIEKSSILNPIFTSLALWKPSRLVLLINQTIHHELDKLKTALQTQHPSLLIDIQHGGDQPSEHQSLVDIFKNIIKAYRFSHLYMQLFEDNLAAYAGGLAAIKASCLNGTLLNQAAQPLFSWMHPDAKKPVHALSAPRSLFVGEAATSFGLIGHHMSFKKVVETATTLAQHPIPILLLGETGSGKSTFARFIHGMSPRGNQPYMVVNCAAFTGSSLDNILFYAHPSSPQDDENDNMSPLSLAHKGTIFLQHIDALPQLAQAQLAQLLENGYVASGDLQKSSKIDIRWIASTREDLLQAIQAGRFREDLYYQLSEIHIPPLRHRRSDISEIANYCLHSMSTALKKSFRLDARAITLLEAYPWPGNIRELKNVLQRATMLSQTPNILPEVLSIEKVEQSVYRIDQLPDFLPGFSLEQYLGQIRKSLIKKALKETEGHQTKAAELLGLSPQAVNRFVRESESKN